MLKRFVQKMFGLNKKLAVFCSIILFTQFANAPLLRGDDVGRMPNFGAVSIKLSSDANFPIAVSLADMEQSDLIRVAIVFHGELELEENSIKAGAIRTILVDSKNVKSFSYEKPHVAGRTPVSISSGNFNGDKFVDFAVVSVNTLNERSKNRTRGSLILFYGKEDGLKKGSIFYPDASFPSGLAVGDINNDRIDDAIIGNNKSNISRISIGSGLENNEPLKSINTKKTTPRSVYLADMNSDKNLDIVVSMIGTLYSDSGSNGGGISIFFGDGKGGFTEIFRAMAEQYLPAILTAGDFDNDRIPDVATLTTSGDLIIYKGDGKGSLKFLRNYENAGVPPAIGFQSISAADLNNDGNLDLVFSKSASDRKGASIVIRYGTGNGKFVRSTLLFDKSNPELVFHNMTVYDIDGDGDKDIVVPAFNKDKSRLRDKGGYLYMFLNQLEDRQDGNE